MPKRPPWGKGRDKERYSLINRKKPSRKSTKSCGPYGCFEEGGTLLSGKKLPRNRGNQEPKPVFDTEIERRPDTKGEDDVITTPVGLDIEEIGFGDKHKQLFKGTYQEAQEKGALDAASKSSKTFTPGGFSQFQKERERALVKGGADLRTIKPTSKPGEEKTIGGGKKQTSSEKWKDRKLTPSEMQKFKFLTGADYDIAKEGKVSKKTRYVTAPREEREKFEVTQYSPESVIKENYATGRRKITDLTTGQIKYETQGKDTEVVKIKGKRYKGPARGSIEKLEQIGKVQPMEESKEVVETDETSPMESKRNIEAAVKASQTAKPMSDAQRARKRRRNKRYAGGASGGRR